MLHQHGPAGQASSMAQFKSCCDCVVSLNPAEQTRLEYRVLVGPLCAFHDGCNQIFHPRFPAQISGLNGIYGHNISQVSWNTSNNQFWFAKNQIAKQALLITDLSPLENFKQLLWRVMKPLCCRPTCIKLPNEVARAS